MNTEQITNSISPELMAQLTETFSSFAAIAVIVFLAFALWGAFQGFRRSIFRQVIHVAVTFILAVIAFSLTSGACDAILESFVELTPAEFVETIEQSLAGSGVILTDDIKAVLTSLDMSTIGYALALVINTVVAPLVFAILFVVIGGVGKIVTSIVCFFVPKAQTLTFKVLGIVGGIVEGALIAGVILLPLVGWVNIAGGAVDVIRENAPEDDESATEIVEFYDNAVLPLEKHAIFQMVGSLGGDSALKKLATVDVDGQETDLRNELNSFIKLGYDIGKLGETNFLKLTEADKSVIDSLIDNCDSDSYVLIPKIACGIVNGFADAIANGVIPVQTTDEYLDIIMEAVNILGSEKTNTATLGANLTTIKNVYFLLSDEGILAMFDATEDNTDVETKLTEALTKKDDLNNTVLNKVIDELNNNENTKNLIPLVGKLAVNALYDSLGIPEVPKDAYDDVKKGIQDVLTVDTTAPEAQEKIEESLTTTLENIGITVSDNGAEGTISSEAVEAMAGYVIEKQEEIKAKLDQENIDINNITDADVLNVLLSYYTNYLEGNNQ